MASFEFRRREVEMEIAGHPFVVCTDGALGERLGAFGEEMTAAAQRMERGEAGEAETVELCRRMTDELLGEGAFEKVFAGREVRLDDCCDVLWFVINEIRSSYESRYADGAA